MHLPLIVERSSEGYCSTLGIVLGNSPKVLQVEDNESDTSDSVGKHVRILESLSLRETVTELIRDGGIVGISSHILGGSYYYIPSIPRLLVIVLYLLLRSSSLLSLVYPIL